MSKFWLTTKDLDGAEKMIDQFVKECNEASQEAYEQKITEARNKIKNLPLVTPSKVELELPEFAYFRDVEKIIITTTPLPRAFWIFRKRIAKKAQENMRMFLWTLGLRDFKIKYKGE
jgi:hypothetical protein